MSQKKQDPESVVRDIKRNTRLMTLVRGAPYEEGRGSKPIAYPSLVGGEGPCTQFGQASNSA